MRIQNQARTAAGHSSPNFHLPLFGRLRDLLLPLLGILGWNLWKIHHKVNFVTHVPKPVKKIIFDSSFQDTAFFS